MVHFPFRLGGFRSREDEHSTGVMDSRGKKRSGISFITSVRAISELQAVLWESHPPAGIPREAGCPGTEQDG